MLGTWWETWWWEKRRVFVDQKIPGSLVKFLARLWYLGAKEPGVIFFPTNWGAKEPQNPQNHRVVILLSWIWFEQKNDVSIWNLNTFIYIHLPKRGSITVTNLILLMEEILQQFRLVVYPMISKVNPANHLGWFLKNKTMQGKVNFKQWQLCHQYWIYQMRIKWYFSKSCQNQRNHKRSIVISNDIIPYWFPPKLVGFIQVKPSGQGIFSKNRSLQ